MAGVKIIDLKPKLFISKNFTMIDLYNSTDVTRSFTRQYKLRQSGQLYHMTYFWHISMCVFILILG